jgi:Rad3-related DNA helicase
MSGFFKMDEYMSLWIEQHKDIENVEEKAQEAWDALSPEIQALMITIRERERQQNQDIHDGLLATLHDYQGAKNIKKAFEKAIRSCLFS